MEPGQFFVLGPAFGGMDPVKVKIGPVQSTHPEPGSAKQTVAPPPPAKIRAILAKLGDLPRDVDGEAGDDPKALRARIAELERQLAACQRGPARTSADQAIANLRRDLAEANALAASRADEIELYRDILRRISDLSYAGHADPPALSERALEPPRTSRPITPAPVDPPRQREARPARRDPGAGSGMEVRVRRVLTVLAQFGGVVTRRKTAAVAGYPPGGSSMKNALSVCRGNGWIEAVGDGLRITAAGRAALGKYDALPTGAALRAYWLEELPDARSRAVFEVLVGAQVGRSRGRSSPPARDTRRRDRR